VQLVEEHLEQGLALWSNPKIDTEEAYSADDLTSTDSPLVREIKRALIREIRPIVALDGGDVAFGKFENSILYVHMRGSCAGCPSSKVTLKSGIEVRMRQLFPEISEVVSL
jgi:Fe-S cluster biogenesis protein NfuA